MAPFLVAVLLVFSTLTQAYVARNSRLNETEWTTPNGLLKRDGDPASFGWIRRWAAVGDSFTAGIGAGHHTGGIFRNRANWRCSRYHQSYPMVLNRAFGRAVNDFQFVACSGDRSEDIYQQVKNLNGDLNLVVLTAGGNDLCLASMIKKCIFLPFYSEDDCQAVIDKAQSNIDTILKPNLKQILQALNDKMADDSIVVYNGYAQYFNTDNEDCATEQNWETPNWFRFFRPLPLTVERRKKFNNLVTQINEAIKSVIMDIGGDKSIKYRIDFSDWDPWPYAGVKGQMCDPVSTGTYPDDAQPDLQFFKPDTQPPPIHDELKRRDLEAYEKERAAYEEAARRAAEENIYDTILWKSANPAAIALHKLDPRAPSPPSCPGDGGFDPTLGLGLPDTFGKQFHPNPLGHLTIASFAAATMMDLRAEVLGVEAPRCQNTDVFKCWQKDGRRAYASNDRMNENYQDFCNNFVKQPPHTVGWSATNTYHKGTPDEHSFTVQLSDQVANFNREECLDSMSRIINSCDGNDQTNPMDWKFGGMWRRGEYTYEVNPAADYRPFPVIQKTSGKCVGWYHGAYSSFEIYGSGFSSYDYGQQTLLPSMKGCLGLGVSKWKFDYINPPTEEGYEWRATFNTPIWVRKRCFSNNKAVQAAGGYTNGCGGND
ncbi:hypothetical protein M426DRAFT_64490 [Hypoxylon sp. CI-4A]|nr:hypothetical protein M426DRAFT_64490 [Hypoxylon sp. CI-4A]